MFRTFVVARAFVVAMEHLWLPEHLWWLYNICGCLHIYCGCRTFVVASTFIVAIEHLCDSRTLECYTVTFIKKHAKTI